MNILTCGIKGFIKDFIEDESGLTAVEYAIAGGLVVGGMVLAFNTLGDNATSQINTLSCAAQGDTTYNAGSEQEGNGDGTPGNAAAVEPSCS